ncbi:MAG: type II CRISPR-associated endonuclease Cas1 [Lentisphaeria bacterium]|nr:type II CRISPR-associated endonuclease Cas1 [Lentisphaeria bacterium]MBR2626575.1 type II CRISPR-associated endonuclease Cas1 [Lentisphaeria bacterium]
MSFRTVVVEKRSKLDLRMGYLVIRQGDSVIRVFLDEINTLIVENPACCVTGCLLSELIKRKIKVIFCDEKHSPSSELIPCYGHGECAGKLQEQILWDKEFCRFLWARIVAEKIHNQSIFLSDKGREKESAMLNSYILDIHPGDITNREGHAAKVYFNAIFGNGFKRGNGMAVDSALNYGYSLILSAFNREIVACGFSTQLGISHHNTFNHFNLSCDLMEPFRVFVDRWVDLCQFCKFESAEKHRVLEIFNQPFIINGEKRRLNDCIMIYTRSIFKAVSSHDLSVIKFCSCR